MFAHVNYVLLRLNMDIFHLAHPPLKLVVHEIVTSSKSNTLYSFYMRAIAQPEYLESAIESKNQVQADSES